jgi:hypothetical protein
LIAEGIEHATGGVELYATPSISRLYSDGNQYVAYQNDTDVVIKAIVGFFANDDSFSITNPWTAESFDILDNDTGYTAGSVTMNDEGTGTGSGTPTFNNSTGELTYLASPDDQGHSVTVDVRVRDNATGTNDIETITLSVPMKPMNLYMGGMNTYTNITDAVAEGWTEGFSAFITNTAQLNAWLNECNTQGRQCYLSLGDGMHTDANISAVVNHVRFNRIDGIEIEGSTSLWTDAQWVKLKDQLTAIGAEDKLFVYQMMYDANPGSYPNAVNWNQRSRLWYPFLTSDPSIAYDADAMNLGRTSQISVRFDPSLYPLKDLADFKAANPTGRGIHAWISCHGQPMELENWDNNHESTVQPGLGHLWQWLWNAHNAGCRHATFYTYNNGLFVDRSVDRSFKGSPLDVLHNMNRNTSSDLAEGDATTPTSAYTYERSWTRVKAAVAAYKSGPMTIPSNSDGNTYETPYVGVVSGGQSATRRP